jgi:mono/diheme cytochrome c family protein
MIRFVEVALSVMAIVGISAMAQDTVKKTPIPYTSPSSGKEMYRGYCAACHGADGKGDGPVATALKVQPTDLTSLASRNNGKFPEAKVRYTLSQGSVAAHGTSDMPIWGPVLKSLSPSQISDSGSDSVVAMRINNLTNYVKSLQK